MPGKEASVPFPLEEKGGGTHGAAPARTSNPDRHRRGDRRRQVTPAFVVVRRSCFVRKPGKVPVQAAGKGIPRGPRRDDADRPTFDRPMHGDSESIVFVCPFRRRGAFVKSARSMCNLMGASFCRGCCAFVWACVAGFFFLCNGRVLLLQCCMRVAGHGAHE